MMFMRVCLKSIYVSYSDYDGTTWSKPKSSGIPSPAAMPTLRRLPNGDLLLIWNWAEEEKINGPWPRNRISSVVSTDDGKTWTSLRHLDGAEDFPGKITMANVVFCDGNAVVTYSKSKTKKNAYNWRLQVIPIPWFYEGDKSVVYGEAYRPTLEAKIAKSKNRAKSIPRPMAKERKVAAVSYPNQAVRSVGRTHQLFIDDDLIARTNGIEQIVNQPAKHHVNPVLTWDKPWEGNCVITWGSILYEPDEKLFKAWYEVYKKYPPQGEAKVVVCYATSRDGIKWDKPNLGLYDFRGSKENNIIMRDLIDAPTVFRDPNPTADVKYRMFWCGRDSRKDWIVQSAISADGIHWKEQEGVRVKAGDRMSAG
jgi:hypothetical protein